LKTVRIFPRDISRGSYWCWCPFTYTGIRYQYQSRSKGSTDTGADRRIMENLAIGGV